MTDNTPPSYAPTALIESQTGPSIWTPGMWLVRRLSLRRQVLLLLLSAWLPVLVVLVLPVNGQASTVDIAGFEALRGHLTARLGVDAVPRWAPSGLLTAAFLASLYLAVCIVRTVFEAVHLLRRGARDLAAGRLLLPHDGDRSDELGQALNALVDAGERMTQLRDAAGQHAGIVARSAREFADAHLAMQLEAIEVRAATGEIARRTVALCGMLDTDIQDAERTSADLEAIHEEEVQALQLMASLRARLFSLAHHCQALGDAARGASPKQPEASGEPVGETSAAAAVDISHCHQLSERVGGAERLNERRIESMRLSTDRLLCRAARGMREAQQLMTLTRQVEASLATTLRRLEQMTASCASLRSLVEVHVAA